MSQPGELGGVNAALLASIQTLLTSQNAALRNQMDASVIANSKAVKRVQRLSVYGTGQVTISAVDLSKTVVILNNDSSLLGSVTSGHNVTSIRNYARLINGNTLAYASTEAYYNSGTGIPSTRDVTSYVEVIEYV